MRGYYNSIITIFYPCHVVEGPALRDYYNYFLDLLITAAVVEGSILKSYYNKREWFQI